MVLNPRYVVVRLQKVVGIVLVACCVRSMAGREQTRKSFEQRAGEAELHFRPLRHVKDKHQITRP